jgi:Zn-dependent M28 family amino/carboxypeptidase
MSIPSLVATGEVGTALADAAASGGRAAVTATGTTDQRDVRSVIAELPGTDPERVVMIGAHLDSSIDGPGINDNGSGVAALLAIAESMAGTRPASTIRFAFWAAEELGLKGSVDYVQRLPARERDRIVAYLNADMLGSPNGLRWVYDEVDAAPGSAAIRDLFAADLDAHGLAWEGLDLGGSSDHLPFRIAGVPTGGLHSGADELISPEQAARFGRTEGAVADACYHLACDDRSNVDLSLLAELASSLTRVAMELAAAG